MAIDLCLQVVNYAHADQVHATDQLAWTKTEHNDMYALLQGSEASGRLTLTIVTGSSKLETVDIGTYVDDATSGRRHAQERGISVSMEQLPIFGITKGPALALRFRRHNGTLRRIQLKLQSPEACRQLVTVLRQRGMEIEERLATARPNTSQMRPNTADSGFRPLIAPSNSPFFRPEQARDYEQSYRPSSSTTLDVNHLRQTPVTASSARDEDDLYVRHADSSRMLLSQGHGVQERVHENGASDHFRQPTLTQNDTAPRFSRDESVAPRVIEPSRPSSSTFWRSHTMQSAPTNNYQPQQDAIRPGKERPSSTSNVAAAEAIRLAVQDRETSSNAASDTRPPSAIPPQAQYPEGTNSYDAVVTSSGPAEPRPQTSTSHTSLTIPEIGAPPRGVQREDSSKRPASSSTSRPGSSALALPPLKRPKLVKDMAPPAKNVVPREMQRPSTLPQPLSERSHNAAISRLTSHTDAPHEIESPPRVTDTSGLNKDDNIIRRALTRTEAAGVGGERSSLERYAAQSAPDRAETLVQFMMEHLEDPSFAKLCEDVENCWQRIVLGL